MTKNTCEATITKRLAWLVEPLVVSSHVFSFTFYFVLDIKTKSQIPFIYVSHFFVFTVLLFSFFVFFSFDSLKLWRTLNIHVNIPCKFLSPPVLMDSTRFSLYAITEVSRKPKHTHFNSWFQNTFRAQFSADQILAPLPGMRTVWFHIFVNFSFLFFWCTGQILSIAEVHTCFCVVG